MTNDGNGADPERRSDTPRHHFQKSQLDAIRILLNFVVGSVGWKNLGEMEVRFTKEQLRDFQKGVGHLNAQSKTKTDIYELLEMLRRRIEILGADYATLLRPVIEKAYDGLPETQPRFDHEDLAIWAEVRDDYNVSHALEGAYHLYRYASDPAEPHQIIRSALRVTPDDETLRPQMTFEASYPTTAEDIAPGTVLIRGTVTSTHKHLYLYGYDRGSATPYLLAIQRHTIEKTYKTFDALMLRMTTQHRLTAARVYGVKARSDADAFTRVSKISLTERSAITEANIDTVLKHIDNRVDGDRIFTLSQY